MWTGECGQALRETRWLGAHEGLPGEAPYLSQGPPLPCPLGFKGASGADQTSRRKSLYFLRTNGNKPLLVYFLVNCAGVGVGLGAGVWLTLSALDLIVPSSARAPRWLLASGELLS